MNSQSRTPAGVPTGGQYSASSHAEADLNLTDNIANGSEAAQAIVAAEDAIRAFEGGLRSGCRHLFEGTLLTAAADLAPHLPDSRGPRLSEHLSGTESTRDSDGRPTEGSLNTLHAEMVDVLCEAPTRKEIEDLERDLASATYLLNDAAVARDLGEDNDEELAHARERHLTAVNALARARSDRRDWTSLRIAGGRPTVYDMLETQDRATDAHVARRQAVNAADLARDAYATVDPSDQRQVHALSLSVDEAIRRESDAQVAFDAAQRELDAAHAAWSAQHDSAPC